HLLPLPYVIKPVAEGSSVGVFIMREDHKHPPQELTRADWPFGDQVLVEPYIPGKELTCAEMGERALGVIELVPTVRFYDYEAKCGAGGSKPRLPAAIAGGADREVQGLGLASRRALGCGGVTRSDFRFDDGLGAKGLFCLEVNSQPGMTETSLVPELAAHEGISFGDLVKWMVEDASLDR